MTRPGNRWQLVQCTIRPGNGPTRYVVKLLSWQFNQVSRRVIGSPGRFSCVTRFPEKPARERQAGGVEIRDRTRLMPRC